MVTSGGATTGMRVPEGVRPKDSTIDVHAWEDMPGVHGMLVEASAGSGEAGRLGFIAVTRRLSTLHRSSLPILSLFGVLLTYHWCLLAKTKGCERLTLADEGWRVPHSAGNSVTGLTQQSGVALWGAAALDSTRSLVAMEEGSGILDRAGSAVIGVIWREP